MSHSAWTPELTSLVPCWCQALRQRHQLPEREVQRLYRVLHIYSLGFQQVVAELCLHAAQRQQLLLAVWKAFSQLWQGALKVCTSVPGLPSVCLPA